jgi:predicted nucleic acid-binding protein
MKIVCSLDTNVLIYAAAGRIDEPRKYAIAVDLLRQANIRLSAQVLHEFASNAIKKFAKVISADELDEWLTMLSRFPSVSVDAELVRSGLLFARRYRISYFDGALLAAAERLETPILYSEDLNHDQLYGSVRVVNPFRPNE